jgi:hypothetical protein
VFRHRIANRAKSDMFAFVKPDGRRNEKLVQRTTAVDVKTRSYGDNNGYLKGCSGMEVLMGCISFHLYDIGVFWGLSKAWREEQA